jgi:ketosteroid isomerase-like protein
MSERDAILFANEAFYLAITHRDIDAMSQVWAERGPVACLHPGWAALYGREEVLDSWRRILSHDEAPKIICREPQVQVHGDVAVVVCYEDIDGQLLVATNIFRREGRSWQMVHHQAGPTAARLQRREQPKSAPKPN